MSEIDDDDVDEAINEVDTATIEALHDMSMSHDEGKACTGRLMKELHPILERWQKREIERGTHPGHLAVAIIHSTLNEISSMTLAAAKDGREIEALTALKNYLVRAFEKRIEQVPKVMAEAETIYRQRFGTDRHGNKIN